MVRIQESCLISALLLTNRELQDFLIKDFIKVEIYKKTKFEKVYDIDYNIHYAEVFWSVNYYYYTEPISTTPKEYIISRYTPVEVTLVDQEATVRPYEEYHQLQDTPNLSASIGTLSLTHPKHQNKKIKHGSSTKSK